MDVRDRANDLRWWDSLTHNTLNTKRMIAKAWWMDEYFPVHFEVCTTCQGRGSYVNPSIDSHGLSAEDFEDYDFREDYFSGVYDIICEHCKGDRVIPVPNEAQHQRELDDMEQSRYEEYAIEEAERRVGA